MYQFDVIRREKSTKGACLLLPVADISPDHYSGPILTRLVGAEVALIRLSYASQSTRTNPSSVPQILPNVTSFLAAAPRGNRLARSTAIYDMDLWRTELSVTGGEQRRRHTRIAHTMRPEQEAALFPDGWMLAFMSGRGGTNQLWLSDGDGNNAIVFDPRQVHHPSWSSDGKQIAYELLDRGGIDIYVKPVRYGAGRRVTDEPTQATRPAWSRNGRWIYFSSNRSGRRDIWKVPAEGGVMVRVTHKGGLRAAESIDGQTIYFTREDSEWAVGAMPVKGAARQR